MTYDGHLVVAAQNGLLVLNRVLTTIDDSYPLPSDKILTKSICIDENGGVYVASNSRTPGGKGLMPVSYTHLDVYKRQDYWCNRYWSYCQRPSRCRVCTLEYKGEKAVSYTHLTTR